MTGWLAFISWPGRTGRCRSRWSVRTLSSLSGEHRGTLKTRVGRLEMSGDWRRCSDGASPQAETPRKAVDPLNDAQTGAQVREMVW